MYPLDRGLWGATSRITRLRDELAARSQLEVISGDRAARRRGLARYAVSGRLRRLDGIYVENSSTLPSETDVAFLGLARAVGVPVLTYIRDAQYLFEEYYPAETVKRRLARSLFLPAVRALRAVSTRVGYPSPGLARAVREPDADPLLLPPGSPAPVDVPREPVARRLLFVGPMRFPVHGLDLLVSAVEQVRGEGRTVEVDVVTRPGEEPPEPRPAWMHLHRASGTEIHRLLPGVIASITPRRRSPYNDLAVPIKVLEYLSYGRPLLVTDCVEQARIVREAACGIVVDDTPDAFAEGIRRLWDATPVELDQWSTNARAAAVDRSWGRLAERIIELLLSRASPT